MVHVPRTPVVTYQHLKLHPSGRSITQNFSIAGTEHLLTSETGTSVARVSRTRPRVSIPNWIPYSTVYEVSSPGWTVPAFCSQLLDDSNDTKDRLELTSTMNYLTTDLKVNIENAELFVVLELLQAPSIGEISRKGYVEGWKDSE
jgi:hypothetical protein